MDDSEDNDGGEGCWVRGGSCIMFDPPFALPGLDGGSLGMRGHLSLRRDGLIYPDPE